MLVKIKEWDDVPVTDPIDVPQNELDSFLQLVSIGAQFENTPPQARVAYCKEWLPQALQLGFKWALTHPRAPNKAN